MDLVKIFRGHFANMKKLAEEKKLVLAGPFVDDKEKRGLYIFNVETIEEARELVKTDPAVERCCGYGWWCYVHGAWHSGWCLRSAKFRGRPSRGHLDDRRLGLSGTWHLRDGRGR